LLVSLGLPTFVCENTGGTQEASDCQSPLQSYVSFFMKWLYDIFNVILHSES